MADEGTTTERICIYESGWKMSMSGLWKGRVAFETMFQDHTYKWFGIAFLLMNREWSLALIITVGNGGLNNPCNYNMKKEAWSCNSPFLVSSIIVQESID